MSNRRTRADYVVFPVALLALWWDDECFDFRNVLKGIIHHAIKTNQTFNEHKDDWNYLKRVADKFKRNINSEILKSCKTKDQPLTSIGLNTLNSYISEIESRGANLKNDLALLAYLAIKSMLGTSAYNHFSWDAILSRMIGNRAGRFSSLPKEKQEELVWANYCLGKRGRESLILRLRKWGVAYIPNGKGFKAPAFSCKLSENELIKTLTNEGKSAINMKEVRHKNEATF